MDRRWSRFWMGGRHVAVRANGTGIRLADKVVRPVAARMLPDPRDLLVHCAQEMNHLAGSCPNCTARSAIRDRTFPAPAACFCHHGTWRKRATHERIRQTRRAPRGRARWVRGGHRRLQQLHQDRTDRVRGDHVRSVGRCREHVDETGRHPDRCVDGPGRRWAGARGCEDRGHQPTAGQFHAFSAVCTHKGCTVNKVADGLIECPLSRKHFQRFLTDRSSTVRPPRRWRRRPSPRTVRN